MTKHLYGIAAVALIAATPASAQLLGGSGGLGGALGGGGLGGSISGDLGSSIDRAGRIGSDTTSRVRGSARTERRLRGPDRRIAGTVAGETVIDNNTRLGERRITPRQGAAADAGLTLDQSMLRTRGAVAATRRGLRRVAPTAKGVQVFVPQVATPAPPAPSAAMRSYPAYGTAYYYGPDAYFVGSDQVHVYMERQYQDMETSLRGTGATVTRRGEDLVVMFPADVTFAFDKADIRSRFYGPLNAFARTLSEYPGTDVEIVGHTDAVGPETYNLSLSERRGRSVADFLADRDVSPARLVVEAAGEGDPIASNASVEGRAANRRVELIVHPRAG